MVWFQLSTILVIFPFYAFAHFSIPKPPNGWRLVSPNPIPSNISAPLGVLISLRRSNLDQLDKIFWEVSNPNNPSYGHHLSTAEMSALVSPPAERLQRVLDWLTQQNINIDRIDKQKDYIHLTLPLHKVERLLNVTFLLYESMLTNRRVPRALGPISIPKHLSDDIELISGISGFPLEKQMSTTDINDSTIDPLTTTIHPSTIYSQYKISSSHPPVAGNIQAIVQFLGFSVGDSDLDDFCSKYTSLTTPCKITKYIGGNNGSDANVESNLDSQFIMGVGQGVETWVYGFPPGSDYCASYLQLTSELANSDPRPAVVSISYGSQYRTDPYYCNQTHDRFNQDLQKLGAMGVTVLVASGDSGAAYDTRGYLTATWPCSTPYALCVGGTDFIDGSSGPEKGASLSGGGFAVDIPRPTYQTKAVQHYLSLPIELPPSKLYNPKHRASPDVASFAKHCEIIYKGQSKSVSGTSCSTPIWAGIISLLNNERIQSGKTLGFVNTLFYQHPEGFTDITVGNNKVGSPTPQGYVAAAGWDPVTGMGVPNFPSLLKIVKQLP